MSALNDAEWLRRQLGPHGADDADQNLSGTGDADAEERPRSDEFAELPFADAELILGALPPDGADGGGRRTAKPDHNAVVRFGGLAAAGTVISLLATMLFSGGDKPAAQSGNDPVNQPAAVAATATPTPLAAEAAGIDRPLPFTASANCPAGSTSAQSLAGSDQTNAFVCVRDLVDGQVIQLDLSKTYVITAISITPGWVGKDSSGASQWAQHRVVTRVQYTFNDTDRTMVVQDTGNVHGEAVQPVKHVLASKVTVLILQTSRPPAETSSPVPTPGLAEPGGGLFGGDSNTNFTGMPSPTTTFGLGGQPTTDPVDHTFAISTLKIIGHEAV